MHAATVRAATVVEIRPKNDSNPISKACAAAENFGRFWFSETYSETTSSS
jgi:hypothetical protein